ncbi:hypothetical protein ACP70R_043128 [Stipagrostis hirtigluma subsp. patula]
MVASAAVYAVMARSMARELLPDELGGVLVDAMANHLRYHLYDLDLSQNKREERIVVFTTNYKDRLGPALLRSGRMDTHVYMGYCGWEAFKTLAKNYFLVDDHSLFPKIQALLSEVEVTPAVVAEMLLRSEDADVALRGLVELLRDQKKPGGREEK